MLNQAAVEALYSATYVENYLDCVEFLPETIQRHISKIRELDVTYEGLLREIEQHQETVMKEGEATGKWKIFLTRVQQILISAQEVGDNKLNIIQQAQDIIDNKCRQLDIDYRNLAEVGKEQDLPEVPSKETNVAQLNSLSSSNTNSINNNNNNNNNNGNSSGERQSKRARRTRTDLAIPSEPNLLADVQPLTEAMRVVQQSVAAASTASSNSSVSQKKTGAASAGKKKKRKSRQVTQQQQQQQQQQHQSRDESPPHEEDLAIDPDEPTYCLCDQISYGEMIMCDNDLCPYEWFHFSCVSLGVKPKGKWYCPKCRGDRSSIMKPKAQLLKELERYNKEKELRDEKAS